MDYRFKKLRGKPLDEQVAAYKRQFELYAQYQKSLEEIKSMKLGIEAEHQLVRNLNASSWAAGWDGSRWNWDPSWDGFLVQKCYDLENAGFRVMQFYRKQKIVLQAPDPRPSRSELMRMILEGAGDDWVGCQFKPQIAIWWQSTSRTYGR